LLLGRNISHIPNTLVWLRWIKDLKNTKGEAIFILQFVIRVSGVLHIFQPTHLKEAFMYRQSVRIAMREI
jgi:hypothetical protein